MIAIHISKEIEASLEQVWNIVSDVDREPEYWQGTKSIKNIKKRRECNRKRSGNRFQKFDMQRNRYTRSKEVS
jgi:hypothetical protein